MKPSKRKLSAAERGYIPRARAAKALREIADIVEARDDGQLCKLSVSTSFTKDDGSRRED